MQTALLHLQDAVRQHDLDGWLLYDFQGLNPYARTLLGIPKSAHLTRRYFVWIPREGQPSVIHHRIEGGTWRALGRQADLAFLPYSAHTELDAQLTTLLGSAGTIAMEYSDRGAVPYVSRVDAGTLERVRETGVTVHSSADLLQRFLVWSADDLAAHQRAVDVLVKAKDEAFHLIHERLKGGQPVTELDAQRVLMDTIQAAGMHSGHAANVSFAANAADPHYEPSPERHATLERGQCVLMDLWCQEEGRPFADITWMGFAGPPDAEFLNAWHVVAGARDQAVQQLRHRREGLQGWEVDRAARTLIENAGLGEFFMHRLGHNLGVELHGPGANLDDLETHDTRTLLPGLAVTVEPGVYPAARGYGIRSEINLYLTPDGAQVTTPLQVEPFILGEGEWAHVHAQATQGDSVRRSGS